MAATARKKAAPRLLLAVPVDTWRQGLALGLGGDYTVTPVATGAEMLAASVGHVLLVLEMDTPNFWSLLAQVRAKHPTMKVVLVACKPEDKAIRRAMRMGVGCVWCYTLGCLELLVTLRNVLLNDHHYGPLLARQMDEQENRELAKLPVDASELSAQQWRCVKYYCSDQFSTMVSMGVALSLAPSTVRTNLRRACTKMGLPDNRCLIKAWHAGRFKKR